MLTVITVAGTGPIMSCDEEVSVRGTRMRCFFSPILGIRFIKRAMGLFSEFSFYLSLYLMSFDCPGSFLEALTQTEPREEM